MNKKKNNEIEARMIFLEVQQIIFHEIRINIRL